MEEVKMGKDRWVIKRRNFIRAGFFAGITLSLWKERLFSSIGVPSGEGKSGQSDIAGRDCDYDYNILERYGAEFGAIKPHMRRR